MARAGPVPSGKLKPDSLHVLHRRAIDMHKMRVTAAERLAQPLADALTATREFRILPNGLQDLIHRLLSYRVSAAAMEGTLRGAQGCGHRTYPLPCTFRAGDQGTEDGRGRQHMACPRLPVRAALAQPCAAARVPSAAGVKPLLSQAGGRAQSHAQPGPQRAGPPRSAAGWGAAGHLRLERSAYPRRLGGRAFVSTRIASLISRPSATMPWVRSITPLPHAWMPIGTLACAAWMGPGDHERLLAEDPSQLTADARQRIEALTHDFSGIWHSPQTSPADRKRILGTILNDVTQRRTSTHCEIGMRFYGGGIREVKLPLPSGTAKLNKVQPELVQLVVRFSAKHDCERVAAEINRRGHTSHRGRPFSVAAIRRILRANGVPSRTARLRARGFRTARKVARAIRVSHGAVRNWTEHGLLHCEVVAKEPKRSRVLYAVPDEEALADLLRNKGGRKG